MITSLRNSLVISSNHAQCAGRNHPCEDVVYYRITDTMFFYGLADGLSGKSHGATGGRVSLEVIADYIDLLGIECILSTPFPDELPCAFVQRIRLNLIQLANDQKTNLHEFFHISNILRIANANF